MILIHVIALAPSGATNKLETGIAITEAFEQAAEPSFYDHLIFFKIVNHGLAHPSSDWGSTWQQGSIDQRTCRILNPSQVFCKWLINLRARWRPILAFVSEGLSRRYLQCMNNPR